MSNRSAAAKKAWVTRRAGLTKMSLADIKLNNRLGGSRFFAQETTRVYKTKIHGRVHSGRGGDFLVTSERKPGGRRLYTVRRFHRPTGRVIAVGKFQRFWTRALAHTEAGRLARTK